VISFSRKIESGRARPSERNILAILATIDSRRVDHRPFSFSFRHRFRFSLFWTFRESNYRAHVAKFSARDNAFVIARINTNVHGESVLRNRFPSCSKGLRRLCHPDAWTRRNLTTVLFLFRNPIPREARRPSCNSAATVAAFSRLIARCNAFHADLAALCNSFLFRETEKDLVGWILTSSLDRSIDNSLSFLYLVNWIGFLFYPVSLSRWYIHLIFFLRIHLRDDKIWIEFIFSIGSNSRWQWAMIITYPTRANVVTSCTVLIDWWINLILSCS